LMGKVVAYDEEAGDQEGEEWVVCVLVAWSQERIAANSLLSRQVSREVV